MEVFFAEKGRTFTSGNHLHTIASQEKLKYESFLKNTNFVDQTVELIGSDAPAQIIKKGYDNDQLLYIKQAISKIAELNSLIAWLAEARKAKENKIEAETLSFTDWRAQHGLTLKSLETYDSFLLNYSIKPYKTEQDLINEFDVKERCEWESLIAEAAVIGKYIHEEGILREAREKAHNAITNASSTSGQGRDTVIYKKSVSADINAIDNLYSELQRRWREIDKRQNAIRSQLKKQLIEINNDVDEYNTAVREEASNEYRKLSSEVKEYNDKLLAQYNIYLREKNAELAKIQIAIPNKFIDLVNELESL